MYVRFCVYFMVLAFTLNFNPIVEAHHIHIHRNIFAYYIELLTYKNVLLSEFHQRHINIARLLFGT